MTEELTLAAAAPEAEAAVRQYMLSLSPLKLTGLENATETAKSLILGVALVEGFISSERATRLTRLELDHQVRRCAGLVLFSPRSFHSNNRGRGRGRGVPGRSRSGATSSGRTTWS